MSRPAYRARQSQLSFPRFAAFAVLAAISAASQQAVGQSPTELSRKPAATPTRRIVVSLPDRKLALLEGERILKIYDVAVGASVSPSPDGEYRIAHRLGNPAYYHPGTVIGPGASNSLGPHWIGLDVKGFGIHGTNHPESIGKDASHGCIRLRNRDIEDLFARVQVGDRVSLIAERNKEVARLFGATETIVAENEPPGDLEGDSHGER